MSDAGAAAAAGLPDPVTSPRPRGEPDRLRAGAAAWAAAAHGLIDGHQAAEGGLTATTPVRWAGQGADACAEALRATLSVASRTADGLRDAADAVRSHADVLATAQLDWDEARRTADRDTDEQLAARAAVEAARDRLCAAHLSAVAASVVTGTLPPTPVPLPEWRPDPDSPGRRRAVELVRAAHERLARSARVTASALEQARLQAWPLPDEQATAARDTGELLASPLPPGWSVVGALRPGSPQEWRAATVRRHRPDEPCRVDIGVDGAGFVEGPDGERYALVVPWQRLPDGTVVTGEESADGAFADLDGTDLGWRTVYAGQGAEQFPTVTPTDLSAAAIAGTAGTQVSTPDLAALDRLLIGRTGYAVIPRDRTGGDVAGPPPSPVQLRRYAFGTAPSGGLRFTELDDGEVGDPSGPGGSAYQRRAAARVATGSKVDLATAALEGATNVSRLLHADDRRYDLRLEVNADGRRRALLTTYQVMRPASAPKPMLHQQLITVRPDGTRAAEEVVWRPSDQLVLHPPLDDYYRHVGRPVRH